MANLAIHRSVVVHEADAHAHAIAGGKGRDPLVYDLDWNEDERLSDWRAAVAETAALPPVLVAALALDAWEQIAGCSILPGSGVC